MKRKLKGTCERPELLVLSEKGLGIGTFPLQDHMVSPFIL